MDFIDDNFKEFEEGPSGEGEVGGIQTQALPLNYRHKNRYTKDGSALLGTVIGMSGGLAIAGMLGVTIR